MAKNKFRKIFFGWAALPIWLALLTFGLTELLSRFPGATETVYSQVLFPVIASLLTQISRHTAFSIDDAFYGLLIVSLIILLLLTIFRKLKFGRFLLIVVQTLALVYVLFYWFWGFNYFRSGLNQRLGIERAKPDTIEFVQVLENLIKKTNDSYCTFDSITYPEIDSLVEASYKKNAAFLKIRYPEGKRRPKPITLSRFFAEASIAGYYGPFFSEAHVNDRLLAIEYPQVLAHEFAHQFGITSEAEANFYSWLVCTRSHSRALQYSANINTLGYFLVQAKHLHNFADLVHQIHKPVIDDIRRIQDHWEKLRNAKIDKVAGKVNDVYLKTNKIEKGIEDYFGIVQFVMDFETDSLARKKVDSRSGQ